MGSRVRKWSIIWLISIILATGCQADPASSIPQALDPPATPTIKVVPTKPPTATAGVFKLQSTFTPAPTRTLLSSVQLEPQGYPRDINPLTGLRIEDPDLLERRPMVVKITNFPRSVRPQWGLNSADHIYEYYLEDELTRFVGIFYGKNAEQVGPIRSARPFDEHLIRAYKGVFAFAFADDRLIEFWENSDIQRYLVFEGPNNCPPMCRIGSKDSYNNLYTDTSQLSDYAARRGMENSRQNLNGLIFRAASQITLSGEDVSRVEIRFSSESYHYWQYFPGTSRYYRWQDLERRARNEEAFEPLLDNLSGDQVFADNLVILRVPVIYFYKSNSTEVFDFRWLGNGEAYALREGKIYSIQWHRPNPESLLSLTFPNGNPYPLKPGNVWFEVLSDVSNPQRLDQTWRFDFELPAFIPVPTETPKKRSP